MDILNGLRVLPMPDERKGRGRGGEGMGSAKKTPTRLPRLHFGLGRKNNQRMQATNDAGVVDTGVGEKTADEIATPAFDFRVKE